MRKFLYFLPTILLVGCYNEEVYPLDPNEPAIAEVDLSGLEYALDLEHVAIEPVYYEPKGTNIQELVGDKRYIKLIYGKVENISSEDKLAEYLKDRLTNFDARLGIIYANTEFPAAAIEDVYKQLMNAEDVISATLFSYGYQIEKIEEGYFIDISNFYSTNKIELVTIDKEMNKFLEELNLDGLSDVEKVKTIYQAVINRMEYVDGGLIKHHSAMGFVMDGEGVCQAYAISLYMLLERAGLEARYIIGDIYEDQVAQGESTAHAWNMVKLDGEWYHLDATWDDDVDNWSYFLVSDGIMEISRTWEKQYYYIAQTSYEM